MIQLSPRLQLQTLYSIITRDTLIRTLHDFPPTISILHPCCIHTPPVVNSRDSSRILENTHLETLSPSVRSARDRQNTVSRTLRSMRKGTERF